MDASDTIARLVKLRPMSPPYSTPDAPSSRISQPRSFSLSVRRSCPTETMRPLNQGSSFLAICPSQRLTAVETTALPFVPSRRFHYIPNAAHGSYECANRLSGPADVDHHYYAPRLQGYSGFPGWLTQNRSGLLALLGPFSTHQKSAATFCKVQIQCDSWLNEVMIRYVEGVQ